MLTAEFLITSLIVVLIPGTGVIYTVSTGLVQGRIASIYAALGCTAGIVPHLLATVLGLAAVMHTSALAFQVLKLAGVAYLFYVAYATWRDTSAFSVDGTVSKASATGLMVKAFLLDHPIAMVDPEVFTAYGIKVLPTVVVIDGKGVVSGVQSGADAAAIDRMVAAALGGGPPVRR